MFAKLHRGELIVVDRSAIKAIRGRRLVYVLVASRPRKYKGGRSAIVYIGCTGKGIARVASSAAYHARWILAEFGVRKFTARVVTCRGCPGLKMWHVLEGDLLLTFESRFRQLPWLNKLKPRGGLSGRFSPKTLEHILTTV
jgi:hypothetical protein